MPDSDTELAEVFRLDGKVVVITGAGSGLGQEASRVFALAGARLVLVDINEAGLAETAKLIAGEAKPSLHRVDVADRSAVEALADRVLAETGKLDVWVNAAGLSYLHGLADADAAKAEKIIAVNMMGPYWGCVAAARVMREMGGGSIVNLSSGGGAKPVPGLAIYGMTKAAVNSLTWTSAAELGPFGIRVNAIAPGWIETPMGSDLFRDTSGKIDADRRDQVRRSMAEQSPMGILGRPSDIAYALLYLASNASRFVTGQILTVNGGESM
jgi:3-oxoacyl-[acyl-carrier protein] reductase